MDMLGKINPSFFYFDSKQLLLIKLAR